MRFAKRVLTLLTVASTITFAQLAPEPQVADIPLMKDSTTNQPMKMDFSVPLTGISDPGILFSHFSNRPLLIYYFSPKCPHCQRHMPEIQDLMKDYEKSNKGNKSTDPNALSEGFTKYLATDGAKKIMAGLATAVCDPFISRKR